MPNLGRLFEGAAGNFYLVFGGARHSLLVDQTDDDARAVIFGEIENFRKSRFAVLVIR